MVVAADKASNLSLPRVAVKLLYRNPCVVKLAVLCVAPTDNRTRLEVKP